MKIGEVTFTFLCGFGEPRIGIGMKALSPGGMKTDFFTRSFDTAKHESYDELVNRVMDIITDSKQMEVHSTSAQIAEVVFEAATDGNDQLRYTAGKDAIDTVAFRKKLGDEAFVKAMDQ